MQKVTKKVTKKETVSCCTSFVTAQCCSKSFKVVAGCHN